MKGSPDRIQACTTTHFDGTISVIDPEKSWVARWQRTSASFLYFFFVLPSSLPLACGCWYVVVDKYVRGVYAITVKGRIPEDVEQELEVQGIKYRPRDQTEVDWHWPKKLDRAVLPHSIVQFCRFDSQFPSNSRLEG
jgi:Spt4/RpoE2 zinc finger protein